MSDPRPTKRLALVERGSHGGLVLERALAARGWTVTRSGSGRALTPEATRDCDVVLLALDDDDTDVFETLLWLSSEAKRPGVVLMTRRANARALSGEVLTSLGVDRVVGWPCRVDQIDATAEAALQAHAPQRLVS